MDDKIVYLKSTANLLRDRIIERSHRTKTPHLGSCLSCIDILTVLYFHILKVDPKNPRDEHRDRFILSKGHGAPALFQVLALKGYFSEQRLFDSDHDGKDVFGEHPPSPSHLPGIEAATGSLGHGLPIGLGMLLAARMRGLSYRVFALLGDGECNEGTIWEAALLAGKHKLENLVVIVDFNKWQATDRSEDVMELAPFKDKWTAFGWSAFEIDGHDFDALTNLLEKVPNGTGKPVAIIAHTVKGKGVSFMEDDNNWHYRIPNQVEVMQAKQELGLA